MKMNENDCICLAVHRSRGVEALHGLHDRRHHGHEDRKEDEPFEVDGARLPRVQVFNLTRLQTWVLSLGADALVVSVEVRRVRHA